MLLNEVKSNCNPILEWLFTRCASHCTEYLHVFRKPEHVILSESRHLLLFIDLMTHFTRRISLPPSSNEDVTLCRRSWFSFLSNQTDPDLVPKVDTVWPCLLKFLIQHFCFTCSCFISYFTSVSSKAGSSLTTQFIWKAHCQYISFLSSLNMVSRLIAKAETVSWFTN